MPPSFFIELCSLSPFKERSANLAIASVRHPGKHREFETMPSWTWAPFRPEKPILIVLLIRLVQPSDRPLSLFLRIVCKFDLNFIHCNKIKLSFSKKNHFIVVWFKRLIVWVAVLLTVQRHPIRFPPSRLELWLYESHSAADSLPNHRDCITMQIKVMRHLLISTSK